MAVHGERRLRREQDEDEAHGDRDLHQGRHLRRAGQPDEAGNRLIQRLERADHRDRALGARRQLLHDVVMPARAGQLVQVVERVGGRHLVDRVLRLGVYD